MVSGVAASALVASGFSRTLYAQEAAGIETDPIRCWWKADHPAVAVGERFTVALTCGVIETNTVTVVPSVGALEPGAVQLTPFEVVSGVRGEDILSPPWRYFQYQYTLRLIGDGFFGQDVSIPPLTVTYNIKAASGGGAQGIDQSYVLPGLPVRIASLVPRDATDIRDASAGSFADVDDRRFAATAALVVAGLLFGLAAVLVVLALGRAIRGARQHRPATVPLLPAAALLGGSLRTLRQVKADAAREGWSAAHARRALTALRVAAAVALRRPLGQAIVPADQPQREGQLTVRSGLLRSKRTLVSAPVGAARVSHELGNGHVRGGATRASLQALGEAMAAFNAAAYGRERELDSLTLNGVVDDAERAVRRLRLRRLWPTRA